MKPYVPVAVVLVVAAIGYAGFSFFGSRANPEEAQVAKRMGWDAGEYHRALELVKAGDRAHDLTDAEFDEAKSLLSNADPTLASYGLSAMMHLRDSRLRNAAISVARKELQGSGKPLVRSVALIALYRLDAPGWREEVSKAKSSDVEQIRNAAVMIIDKTGIH